jgi:VIT1/CCC1 family predicted Fe2+/Mn2+ transporter
MARDNGPRRRRRHSPPPRTGRSDELARRVLTAQDPVAPGARRREPWHRDVQGGTARAAVFGISDGLVSNVSLILGFAAAAPAPSVVRLAGIAGLLSGACSMAAGEYVSMRAQRELLARELHVEAAQITEDPDGERAQLVDIFTNRGIEPDTAQVLATEHMRTPELALLTHAREELGIDPTELGSPWGAAASSFVAFAVGASVPLVPWLLLTGGAAVWLSVLLGAVAAVAIGGTLGWLTGRSPLRSALRQLTVAALAAALTYLIGTLIGVTIA